MAQAIEYIYDHFKDQPSLDEMASHVAMSPAHFQRQFTEWVGISPKKLVQYLSVEHAKSLLDQQNTVSHAALESGFSGTGRLHDAFINIIGMTPGEYKHQGQGLHIAYQFTTSPFGDVIIAATDKGICFLAFADQKADILAELKSLFPNATYTETTSPFFAPAMQFFERQPLHAPLSLHLKGTPFQLKVWQALLRIPEGQLSSYGQIAEEIGSPLACRAVGTAVGSNHVSLLIPCHRIIRNTGMIGEYRWHRCRKIALLGWEMQHTQETH